MVEFKLTIADPKTGKCYQRTVGDLKSKDLIGLKIGEMLKGEAVDLPGYEFEITGGSDYCGFPMRKGISGARKRILVVKSVGFKGGREGEKRRKTVCGEKIHDKISQINLKILKEGKTKLTAEAKEGEAPKEEKKESAPANEEKKAEEAPKKEEKPKEELKVEEKKEKTAAAKEEKPEEKKE